MNKGKDKKPHIGIFGRRNVGKSSLINALTGVDVAIVSDVVGTTTDPVKKSIEIFGIGPAIIIDTAGIDDTGNLGQKRIAKSLQTISQIDAALLVITNNTFGNEELELIQKLEDYNVPYLIVHNKEDKAGITSQTQNIIKQKTNALVVACSVKASKNFPEVIEALKRTIPETIYQKTSLLEGLINRNDLVMLITPIDTEAPEGRMILPQAMAIRDVLDHNAVNIVLKETEVEHFFKHNNIRPKLVITDSQAFGYVDKIVPQDIPLTGFSVLFAHMRGPFEAYVKGVTKLSNLNDGDRVLMLESCVHQVSCEDIGRYKLPNLIRKFSNKELKFDIAPGLSTIERPMTDYSLVIQCGGCMITRQQVLNRLKPALDAGIPVTNYGLSIAYMNGILERAVMPIINAEKLSG